MKRIEHVGLLGCPLIFSYRITTEKNNFEKFHAHSGLEVLYLHSGEGQLEMDGQTFELKSGTLMIFQPFRLHHLHMVESPQNPYTRTIVLFDPSILEAYLEVFPELKAFVRELLDHETPLVITGSKEANLRLESLFEQWASMKNKSFNREAPLEETIVYVLYLLQSLKSFMNLSIRQSRNARLKNHAERMRQWLDEHYQKEFRLDQMADALHLSPYYISRIFKQAEGVTITEYLLIRRMRAAGLLLETTSLGIKEIARKSGFPSESYFVRTFKKFYGQTPLQFRNSRS